MPLYVGDVEITKREIIVVTIAALLLTIVGFLIANNIAQRQDNYNVKFYEAVQVSDSVQFNYALKTNAGNMLAYGTVKSIGFVTDSAIGNYMTLTRKLEEYRQHHRTVCSGEGKDRHCHTETYWSWDYISSKNFSVSKVNFLGRDFSYSEFPRLPDEHYVATVNLPRALFSFKNKQRYVYYGRNLQYTGTMYTNADFHRLNESIFANGVTLDGALEHFVAKHWVMEFWIIFSIILIVGAAAFVAADNDWLNG